MKLHEGRVNLEVDVPNSKTFSIQSSSNAFDILSTLYTNQPLAIVRELMCNAYDAQIAAKYDGPAEFHCPTTNEPYLIIRDFGTGMTEEVIYDTYTVMFKSSKTDSNDYTGALGLGAKSPFCIVNNFSVYTYIDGVETIWLVYKNDKGIPSISKIGTNTTTEKNGTKILIDIPPKYINDFTRSCQSAFQWFKVLPVGNLVIEPPSCQVLVTPEYSLSNASHGVTALMGNVLYSINLEALGKTYNYAQRQFLNNGLILHFNIGDLDFVPSREQLKINSRTQAQIINRINFVFAKVSKELQDQINQCENLYEARRLAVNNRSIIDMESTKFTYKGHTLSNYLGSEVVDFDVYSSYRKPHKVLYLRADSKYPIIINDLKRGAWTRAKFNCGYNFQIIPESKLDFTLSKLGFSKEYGFKHNILRRASELPVKPSTQKSRKTAKVSSFKESSYVSDCWATEVDISTVTGYYIELDRYNGMYENTAYSTTQITDILKFFKKYNIDIPLYGIRKTVSEKSYKHLKPFIPFVREKFKELCKTTKFEYSTGSPYIKYHCHHLLPKQLQDLLKLNSQLISATTHGTINMFDKIGEIINVTDRPQTVNYKELVEEQLSKYQLIMSNPQETHIKKYIELVDSGVLR